MRDGLNERLTGTPIACDDINPSYLFTPGGYGTCTATKNSLNGLLTGNPILCDGRYLKFAGACGSEAQVQAATELDLVRVSPPSPSPATRRLLGITVQQQLLDDAAAALVLAKADLATKETALATASSAPVSITMTLDTIGTDMAAIGQAVSLDSAVVTLYVFGLLV